MSAVDELHAAIAAFLRRQRPTAPQPAAEHVPGLPLPRRRTASPPVEEREVAIYARTATMTQGNRTALESQIAACRAYAVQRGHLDLVIYQEVMGGDTLNRPRLAELRAAIAHGWVRAVLVTTTDHLTRDPLLLAALRAEWVAAGVALVAVMGEQ